MSRKIYRDYFNIDPKYYAAVTADLINSGKVSWKSFYPHETFVKLLQKTHDVLSGKEPRSLWVEGAYGTGKSHAALTVKSLLEASDEEVREYFTDYKLSQDLCQKLITDKNAGKLLTIHRIGSGAIRSDQDLILAVQDCIMSALAAHGLENHGEASLRDAALSWLEKEANRNYFGALIAEEEYAWKFGGEDVDAIMERLRTGSSEQVTKLMRDVIAVAEANGITALRMDIEGMAAWIKSVIEGNHLSAILFVWDEFTEFFQNNPNSLTGFQTLAEISLSHPFYFMIVSHQSKSLFANAETAKKILDRFVPPIKIELPENMAFRLMAQAMKVTSDPVLRREWERDYRPVLNEDLASVRAVIRDSAKKSTTFGEKTVISEEELQAIVPIHPYAALVLKHLSVAFNSNQRSMFDFIINNNSDAKAFKWFIANYGPLDQINLLTIDMLWDFFYGKGQNGLNEDVRVILDSYNLLNSAKMSSEQQRVLKTILLLQAISLRVGDVELLKPNEKNVDLAFGGTGWSKGKAHSIAENLVEEGLLFKKSVGGGKYEYTVANSTGDAETIRKKKAEVRDSLKTQDLVVTADLMSAVALPAAIDGRFERKAAAARNFAVEYSKLKSEPVRNRFKVLVTFAVSETEAAQTKSVILRAINNGEKDIIFIDAGLTPMGEDLLDQYVESMAYSHYYAQNDKHRAGEYQNQAIRCLSDWKSKIAEGAFMLYSAENPSGMRMANIKALQDELGALNHQRYPYGPEQFNVIANMFTATTLALGAECGIRQKLSGTFKAPNEKTSLATALSGAWEVEKYWENPANQMLPIVRIKKEVERLVEEGFQERSGRISMSAIYDALSEAPYGLMPNNLSAFILGFVLKEYASGDYFWSNGANSEVMEPDKMKMMIANAIKQSVSPARNFREEYIVAMSGEQRAFLQCTAKAFHIPAAQCGSVESARDQIRISMKQMSFPLWCVKYVLPQTEHVAGTEELSELIDDYCSIANTANGSRGSESELASGIGQRLQKTPVLAEDLARLLTNENCRKGMLAYIGQFQGGILPQLAAQIGDNGAYLAQVQKKFSADAANWVWNTETADDKICDVILDYQIIAESNKSLQKCTSIAETVRSWNSKTNNIRISYEAVKNAVGDLAPFLEELYHMKVSGDLMEQRKRRFYELLLTQREAFDRFYRNQAEAFRNVASSFLGDLEESDTEELYSNLPSGQFTKSGSEYFRYVEGEVSRFLNGQLKNKIQELWMQKTGTKSPADWSERYDTPILCMFNDAERETAKEIFRIMRESSPTETNAERVMDYLSKADFYDRLADPAERDRCFMERVVGDYDILLKDPQRIRDELSAHTGARAYEWMDNSAVQNQLKNMADKQYKTSGYERAWSVIDQMDSGELRTYLKDLISDNVKVGMEILRNR